MAMICVSVAQPLANSGRSGQSISREVNISRSEGAAFALEKPAQDSPVQNK